MKRELTIAAVVVGIFALVIVVGSLISPTGYGISFDESFSDTGGHCRDPDSTGSLGFKDSTFISSGVTLSNGDYERIIWDECFRETSLRTKLSEVTCTYSGNANVQVVRCRYGCFDGACNPPPIGR